MDCVVYSGSHTHHALLLLSSLPSNRENKPLVNILLCGDCDLGSCEVIWLGR